MARALLSVSDKSGITEFGLGLSRRGFELVSTGGTASVLSKTMVVTEVSKVTGFPEMMDGRVKTLHPAVHAGILARRDRADDMTALEQHGIRPFDVVAINLYQFAKAAANQATPFDDLVEQIDIGGPALIRAAAKNFKFVYIVTDPADYSGLLSVLDSKNTPAQQDFRWWLMRKAISHTGYYDLNIAKELQGWSFNGITFERKLVMKQGA